MGNFHQSTDFFFFFAIIKQFVQILQLLLCLFYWFRFASCTSGIIYSIIHYSLGFNAFFQISVFFQKFLYLITQGIFNLLFMLYSGFICFFYFFQQSDFLLYLLVCWKLFQLCFSLIYQFIIFILTFNKPLSVIIQLTIQFCYFILFSKSALVVLAIMNMSSHKLIFDIFTFCSIAYVPGRPFLDLLSYAA